MGRQLVREFITEEFQASVQEVLDNALKGKETANFEFPLITEARDEVEVLLNGTSRCDIDGNVVGMVGIGQDITARIAQEQEYSRSSSTARTRPFFWSGHELTRDVNVWNVCNSNNFVFYKSETLGNSQVDNFIPFSISTHGMEGLSRALRGIETAISSFPS